MNSQFEPQPGHSRNSSVICCSCRRPAPAAHSMLARTPAHAEDLRRRVTWAFWPKSSAPRAVATRCETIPGVNTQTADSAFIRACRRQPVSRVPVWYMRQAGRSLPEYRATRAGTAMLDATSNPDIITEITMQPVRRYGVDAAILFSDIVVPLRAAGLDIDIRPGVGPVVDKPVSDETDVVRLRALEPGDVSFVSRAVEMLTAELGGIPLIGFAGGPFTLACYLVEGGPSKTFDRTRSLMYASPAVWDSMLGWLTDITIAFLLAQVHAGASAVQLFDSWAGIVSPEDYRRGVLPFSRRIFAALASQDVPAIHFGV